MDPTPPSTWYAKRRYHHGNLAESALARGREVVALRGPAALTLRGLARDLGVSAAALVRYFGSIAGLRIAVSESVLGQLDAACAPPRSLEAVGADWIAFATANPNLYRLAAGELWHQHPIRSDGSHGPLATPSPRRLLERALRRRTRREGRPQGDVELARHLAVSIHGLAIASIDGAPSEAVARALKRAAQPA